MELRDFIKLFLFIFVFKNAKVDAGWQNNRPIIGVLAQETSHSLETMYPGEFKSYIAASYVKFLEAAGARVVPVWIGKDKEYYEGIVNKTNG